jgi:hypothetical protein
MQPNTASKGSQKHTKKEVQPALSLARCHIRFLINDGSTIRRIEKFVWRRCWKFYHSLWNSMSVTINKVGSTIHLYYIMFLQNNNKHNVQTTFFGIIIKGRDLSAHSKLFKPHLSWYLWWALHVEIGRTSEICVARVMRFRDDFFSVSKVFWAVSW